MSKFKPNQSAVCIRRRAFSHIDASAFPCFIVTNAPKFNEEVVVERYEDEEPGYIYLKGYGKCDCGFRVSFSDEYFEPLPDISEVDDVLNKTLTPIEY